MENYIVDFIKDVTDFNDFEEKINLLRKIGKYEEAANIIFEDKKADKQMYFDILVKEKPELKNYIQNLMNKPK